MNFIEIQGYERKEGLDCKLCSSMWYSLIGKLKCWISFSSWDCDLCKCSTLQFDWGFYILQAAVSMCRIAFCFPSLNSQKELRRARGLGDFVKRLKFIDSL